MKHWTHPQLVVLGRATPEESVLQVCKNHEIIQPVSPGNDRCGWRSGAVNECRGVTGS
jgi:hypothetical protein